MSGTVRMARELRGGARAFFADSQGLAAIELALILPVALMLMSLVVFGGQAYGVQRKVTLSATTVAAVMNLRTPRYSTRTSWRTSQPIGARVTASNCCS